MGRGIDRFAVVVAWTVGLIVAASHPAPAQGVGAAQTWAVVVGVQDYADADIPDSPGAIRDARAVHEALVEALGPDRVTLLHDGGAARPDVARTVLAPTAANLAAATGAGLSAAKPGDLVVLYFAGQSATVDGRSVLLPIDARAGNLAGTGWDPEAAINTLAGAKGCRVAFWLDASLKGRPAPVPKSADDPAASARLVDRLSRWPGTTTWLAADGKALPVDGKGPSPFVAALLRGLKGDRPTLLATLATLQADPALRDLGFRSRGGVPPWLALRGSDRIRRDMEPVLRLQRGHAAEVNAVALAPDGEVLVSGSSDSTVRIWSIAGPEPILLDVIAQHLNGVGALAIGPDGRFLVSGDGYGRVLGYDLAAVRPLEVVGASQHLLTVRDLLAGPGGTFLSRDDDGKVVRWRVADGRLEPSTVVEVGALAVAASARGDAKAPFAVAGSDAKIALIASEGPTTPAEVVEGPGGFVTALAMADDGRLAAGDEDGRILLRDPARPDPRRWTLPDGPVSAIVLGPGSLLAVSAGDSLRIGRGDAEELSSFRELVGPVEQAAFSPDGRWLAALTVSGALHLWELTDPANPRPVPAIREPKPPAAMSLAFSADGRVLAVGEADGGLRVLDLGAGAATERPRLRPSRGKVVRIDAAPEIPPGGGPPAPIARHLLMVDSDGLARVWDLKDGREPAELPGLWAAGVFLPGDDRRLAMTRHADEGGGLVLVDRESGAEVEGVRFGGPPGPFGRVAASVDGRWIAVSALPGREEIACVWPVGGGEAVVLEGHRGSIHDLSFAADGRTPWLVTACDDGLIRLYRFEPGGPPAQPTAIVRRPTPPGVEAEPMGATAARLDLTGRPRLLAAFGVEGYPSEAHLIHWPGGEVGLRVKAESTPLGELEGRAHAVRFAGQGRFAVVAGNARRFRVWALPESGAPAEVRLTLPGNRPLHDEQVNDLAAWPGDPIIATASDDASVRLWTLDPRQVADQRVGGPLLGTLIASAEGPGGASEWVAFAPTGSFDGSQGGERIVRFAVDREVRPLEQFAGAYYTFGLMDGLRRGRRFATPPAVDIARLAIDPPAAARVEERTARIRIVLGDADRIDLGALRLYQNGVPVKSGRLDFELEPDGRAAVAEVPLRSGRNDFYAMAGQEGEPGVDARSGDVVIEYLGYERPGRTHVVALGVSEYEKNSLQFAHEDARSLAGYLHEHGLRNAAPDQELQPGMLKVLTDREVTRKSVELALQEVRDAARGRPEDTIVVFLAGHTDILPEAGGERFSLLLPDFPFPDDAPLFVGMRGVGVGDLKGKEFPADTYLPFAQIYRELPRIDALQRLLIVDACQAESILDDQGVLAVRRALETGSRQARNAYFLAARFGEPAGEDPLLKHGLMTFTMLKGLGDQALDVPPEVAGWPEGNADRDGDGLISTSELRRYVDQNLPRLAAQMPVIANLRGVRLPAREGREALKTQEAGEADFPIAVVPR